MPASTSNGKCEFCGETVSKRSIAKHVQTCKSRPDVASITKPIKVFQLKVEGRRAPEYWLQLDVPSKTSLKTLDNYLRGIWLECCGHMSQYQIGEEYYVSSDAKELDASSMNYALEKVVGPGDRFGYEYDFGSTTELLITVVNEHQGDAKRDKDIQLLAQNLPLEFSCKECGKPATTICQECLYDGDNNGFLCDDCAEEHECGEEMQLPVVNSPRMGECAYSG